MASGKSSPFLKFLFQREHGLLSAGENCLTNLNQAQIIAEDKSAIPDINKACELSGHSRSTFLVSFSPDRTKVASTHGDHTVRVTELKTGKCTHILKGHPRTPWTVAFHPSSNDILATGCLGGEVRIWDLRGGGSEVWKSEHGKVIASLAFHPADQILVVATNNELLFWDWSRPQPFASCKTKTDYEKVRWCKFDPFGHYLYTGIANKSTIQSDELESSFPELGSEGRSGDYRQYRDNYRQVAEDITSSQRHRMPGSAGLLGAALFGEDEGRPQSPTHSTALRDAQQYAALVTRQSRRQQCLNNPHRPSLYDDRFPPQQSQQQQPHFSRIEIGRVEGPSAPDFENTDDHMQQIHRIPNVYASNGSIGSSGRGLETLANAAEVVSHMDTVTSSGDQSDAGAARTSQPFAGGAAHGPVPSLLRNSLNSRHLSSQRATSSEMDVFLESVGSEQTSISPVIIPTVNGNETDNGILPNMETSVPNSRNRSLFPRSGSSTFRNSIAATRQNDLFRNRDQSSEDNGSAVRIPRNTSQSFLSSRAQDGTSEVHGFLESFLSRQAEGSPGSTSTESRGINNMVASGGHTAEGNLRNDPLLSLPQFPALDELTSAARDREQLVSENADQTSLDDNSSLTVQISEPSDVEDSSAPQTGITAVGANLWENFENNTLNIEIPNMTPNSDDSSSFSGPLRTPRNSADVNRQQQPHQIPSFPAMGLIRPVSPMRTSSSPTMRYGYSTRTPSFARLLDNTLQMAQNNVLESSSIVDEGDNRSTPSDPSSYSQPGSLSRPSSLSPHLESDLLIPTGGDNSTTSERVITVSSSSTPNLSTNQPGSLFNTSNSSQPLRRLDVLTSVSSNERTRVDPMLSSSVHSSQSTRGRNLMHLLETPFPVRSHDGMLAGDRVATDVPQPVGQNSFALPFNTRNQNVRPSVHASSDRSGTLRSRHNPPFCPSPCEVCQTTDSTWQRLPSLPRYSPSNPNRYSTQSTAATSGSLRTDSPTRQQPQRLASIIESEVRQAIDSIHARRISVSDTMRDLDHLHRNLADVPEWPLEEEDEPEVLRFTPVSREDVEMASDTPDLDTLDPELSNSQSSDEQQDSTGVSSYLNNRIQVLNRSVNDLQRRLRERIEQLDQNTAAAHNCRERIENRVHHYSQLASQRQRERRQRMQRHLEALRRRHRTSNVSFSRYGSFAERHATEVPQSSFETESSSRLINLHDEVRNVRLELLRSRIRERRQWRALQRRHLNQDYPYSRLNEEALNQANEFQSVMNRMPFMGTAEPTVSNSIVNLTHRVQRWDISGAQIPNISDPSANVVIPYCKLHNDATADISQDGRLLAMFVPSNRNFPDDTLLGIFSLEPHNLGQCLYTKSFDPNAISVSLSPLNNYVLVGLAVKRLQWVFSPTQMVAQIYKLETQDAGEESMKHICDLMHPCDLDLRMQVSVNSGRWLPTVGEGVVYCTNRGDLHICKPGWAGKTIPSNNDQSEDRRHINTRQLIIQLLRINSPRTNNSATQTTTQGVRRSASTQTDSIPASSDTEWDWTNAE